MESYIHLYKTNDEFTASYNGPDYVEPWLSLTEEGMKVNYNKPKLTAITFDTITWVTDVPAKGGTATKDNCEFKVYGNYDNGISVDISSDVTVTGELAVPSSTADQRHEAGQLTLTASYSGFTATGNVTVYQAADFSTKPLTFKISSPGTINWAASNRYLTKTIEYKLNNGEWTSITSNMEGVKITVNADDKIQFRGNNAAYSTSSSYYSTFKGSTAGLEIEGNIMSLINPTDFSILTTLESNFTFNNLFKGCTGLTSTKNLILPATTLTQYCYSGMFDGCTSLTTAPELPATTLADYCYFNMFNGCTSLTTAPELPATTLKLMCYSSMFNSCASLSTAPELPATNLADNCYESMFYNCTSLTTAPELPANTLADYCYSCMFQNCTNLLIPPELPAMTLASCCYQGMFDGCTSLTTAPQLPATTLVPNCYQDMFQDCTSLTTAPKELPATTLADYCYSYMFNGCTSLTTAPELPATTLAENCYSMMFQGCASLTAAPALPATALAYGCYSTMFQGCTSLTTAPELPATTLADYCYSYMFNGCTKLNYIKCLATDISATSCTNYWVDGVASNGTFVKASSMTSWKTGTSGIPSGWAVEDNQEPLTFNILSAGTINWTASDASIAKTIDYKLNDGEWTSVTSNTGSSAPTITVNPGDKLQFKGNNTQYATSYSSYNSFSGSTALFEVEGNIMSLIYGDNFKNKLTINDYAFARLFSGCANLVSAENLILPATTLAENCYSNMFYSCTKLTTAPTLPATTLADYCYPGMFKGCTKLTTAPKLPATNLASYCYSGMFNGCTSLTTAPALPATNLASYCYNSMFYSCTSLTTVPELPATTLAYSCYQYMFDGCTNLNYIKCLATDVSASDCTYNWARDVASTGTFVKASSMTSWKTGNSGIPTNWTVQNA